MSDSSPTAPSDASDARIPLVEPGFYVMGIAHRAEEDLENPDYFGSKLKPDELVRIAPLTEGHPTQISHGGPETECGTIVWSWTGDKKDWKIVTKIDTDTELGRRTVEDVKSGRFKGFSYGTTGIERPGSVKFNPETDKYEAKLRKVVGFTVKEVSLCEQPDIEGSVVQMWMERDRFGNVTAGRIKQDEHTREISIGASASAEETNGNGVYTENKEITQPNPDMASIQRPISPATATSAQTQAPPPAQTQTPPPALQAQPPAAATTTTAAATGSSTAPKGEIDWEEYMREKQELAAYKAREAEAKREAEAEQARLKAETEEKSRQARVRSAQNLKRKIEETISSTATDAEVAQELKRHLDETVRSIEEARPISDDGLKLIEIAAARPVPPSSYDDELKRENERLKAEAERANADRIRMQDVLKTTAAQYPSTRLDEFARSTTSSSSSRSAGPSAAAPRISAVDSFYELMNKADVQIHGNTMTGPKFEEPPPIDPFKTIEIGASKQGMRHPVFHGMPAMKVFYNLGKAFEVEGVQVNLFEACRAESNVNNDLRIPESLVKGLELTRYGYKPSTQ